jgi:hypothetical protein
LQAFGEAMSHHAVEQMLDRAEKSKTDSDFTYFHTLLLAAEAIAKLVVLGVVAAISDDKDRNRYRLEHRLVRSDGLGDWTVVLEDALTGTASQFLVIDARSEQVELTKLCKSGDWQYESVSAIKRAMDHLSIDAEAVPTKSDMKRWFRLFAILRNKTRAHGAHQPSKASEAATHLHQSISLFYENFYLFKRNWCYLYRTLSGKYRVSHICSSSPRFDYLKSRTPHSYPDGVYISFNAPRLVCLMHSDADLQDYHFANGGHHGKKYELLSYYTGNKIDGDASAYFTPPGTLPRSETQGHGELLPQGKCFSNVPTLMRDYICRPDLERELSQLLLDDKRPIVTLVGRGGIGKTSVALQV